jgi:hypothetical protein
MVTERPPEMGDVYFKGVLSMVLPFIPFRIRIRLETRGDANA